MKIIYEITSTCKTEPSGTEKKFIENNIDLVRGLESITFSTLKRRAKKDGRNTDIKTNMGISLHAHTEFVQVFKLG